jgi:quercetin dioxygenase-like cupin family protein
MGMSRREIVTLLPALAVAGTARTVVHAQESTPPAARIPAQVFHSNGIAYVGDAKKKGRRFFYGAEHTGFAIEMHETVLGPGVETHPPHTHEHEEILIVVEGTVDVSMGGRTETAEAGSVIHYEPSTPHNLRNAGTVPCRYYVVELRGRTA